MDKWLTGARDAVADAAGIAPASLDLSDADEATILDLARIAAHDSGQRRTHRCSATSSDRRPRVERVSKTWQLRYAEPLAHGRKDHRRAPCHPVATAHGKAAAVTGDHARTDTHRERLAVAQAVDREEDATPLPLEVDLTATVVRPPSARPSTTAFWS